MDALRNALQREPVKPHIVIISALNWFSSSFVLFLAGFCFCFVAGLVRLRNVKRFRFSLH